MLNFKGLAALRPWPVYLMAMSVPLSIAAVSVAKLLIFLAALAVLLHGLSQGKRLAGLKQPFSPRVILAMLAALALSVLWADSSVNESLTALGKYGKLLVIPLVLVLLRNRREAMIAMAFYLGAETFVLASSVLLGLGVPLPYRHATQGRAAVFATYLDQSIMTAGFAGLCWHFREEFPRRWGQAAACVLALVAIMNVMFQLQGRTGHACAIAAVSLACYWATPTRWRLGVLAVPLLLVGLGLVASPQFKERATMVFAETRAYAQKGEVMTSTGLRLNLWRSAGTAIAESPAVGWGIGSWSRQYRRHDGQRDANFSGAGGNPHQEYLLWGVHLGVPGIALLLALLGVLVWDARRFAPPERRSLITLVVMLAVACLFNSTLYDALIGDYFCIMLGVLYALGLYPRMLPVAAPATVPRSTAGVPA